VFAEVMDLVSTVGTSTSVNATIVAFERKTLYVNGLFWVFYCDGTHIVYRTSTDGSTWSNATTVAAGTVGQCFSIFHDGTYLHYGRTSPFASPYALYYRRGTLNSDGTITWSLNEVTVYDFGGINPFEVLVLVDSDGYPWLACRTYYSGNRYTWYVKATATDGSTWGTPTKIETANNYLLAGFHPLPNGRLIIICTKAGTSNVVYAYKIWDGSQWSASWTDISTYTSVGQAYFCSTVKDDTVHMVWLVYSSYDIRYVKYVDGSGVSGEVVVQSGTTSTSAPVLSINTANNDLYCFWTGSPTADHIYYKKCVSGTWDVNPTDWITETTDHLTGNDKLACFPKVFSGYIGLEYMTLTASPYNVRFAYLDVSGVVLKEVTDSLSLSDAVLRDKTLAISDSVGLADASLRDKTFQISDSITLSEIIEVVTGAIIKYVADAIGLTEQINVDKVFIVSDTINLAEAVSTPMRILHALDSIGLSDNAYVDKILMVSEQIALAEFVEKTVAGGVKTKIFLLMGDLAIQITG